MRTAPALLLSLFLAAASCGRPAQVPGAVAPRPPHAYELQLGKEVYQTYCAGCHGLTGAGDGFNAFNLDPRPRDLGDPALQKRKSDVDLADAIRRGGAGVGLTSLMPPWGHTIDERHINAVVLYIRSLHR
jgi:mono/diheme cytochrome c family protein